MIMMETLRKEKKNNPKNTLQSILEMLIMITPLLGMRLITK
jgi:hypothetical protein